MKCLGVALKVLRQLSGRTIQQLAKETEIHVSHLSQIENGQRLPQLPTLQKFGDLYGVEVADIIDLGKFYETATTERIANAIKKLVAEYRGYAA